METAVADINTAVETNNVQFLSDKLSSRTASLFNVNPDNMAAYMQYLTDLKHTDEYKDAKLTHTDIQNCVTTANETANSLKNSELFALIYFE